MAEYQVATFVADGHVYNLADEIRCHMLALVVAEQERIQRETGQRPTVPRRRPKSKRKGRDGEHAEG
jgi:hypothetical protein